MAIQQVQPQTGLESPPPTPRLSRKYQLRVSWLLKGYSDERRARLEANHEKMRILAGKKPRIMIKSKSKPKSRKVAPANKPSDKATSERRPLAGIATTKPPTNKHTPSVLGEKTASGRVIVSTRKGRYYY